MTKNLLGLALFGVLLAGCVGTTVTNLTSTTQPRNPTGQYRIEYQWDTTQQTVRPTSLKPVAIIGYESYEMKPVLRTTNRWEVFVPVAADQSQIIYRFKVGYQYNRFGKPGVESKLSPEYRLIIK